MKSRLYECATDAPSLFVGPNGNGSHGQTLMSVCFFDHVYARQQNMPHEVVTIDGYQ